AGLLVPFSDDEPPDARLLAELLPRVDRPPPADAVVNPINVLRIAVEIDRRTLESAERLIHVRPDLPVLAVYLPGFDKVCHAFWQYRFPGTTARCDQRRRTAPSSVRWWTATSR